MQHTLSVYFVKSSCLESVFMCCGCNWNQVCIIKTLVTVNVLEVQQWELQSGVALFVLWKVKSGGDSGADVTDWCYQQVHMNSFMSVFSIIRKQFVLDKYYTKYYSKLCISVFKNNRWEKNLMGHCLAAKSLSDFGKHKGFKQ